MHVELHPHASQRLGERGTSESEIIETVLRGDPFAAKFGRLGFRKIFTYDIVWRGKRYGYKEVEAIAVPIPNGLLVLTVITRYFED